MAPDLRQTHIECGKVKHIRVIQVSLNIKKEGENWYNCQRDNSPQETKMTQKLTTIGQCTVFNNE